MLCSGTKHYSTPSMWQGSNPGFHNDVRGMAATVVEQATGHSVGYLLREPL
jgi:hypothetical protein